MNTKTTRITESTEGIDVAEENQRKAEALLDQLEQDES